MAKNKEQKEKYIERQIELDTETKEYVFQMKKKCLWCWLLLLLLLLPLLWIRIGDTISYKIKSSCPIEYITDKTIHITYIDADNKAVDKIKNIDTNKKVTFNIKGRRIYMSIFLVLTKQLII